MTRVMTTELADESGNHRTVTETRTAYAVTDGNGNFVQSGRAADGKTGAYDAIKGQERGGFRQQS
jgi:hypothetical protein